MPQSSRRFSLESCRRAFGKSRHHQNLLLGLVSDAIKVLRDLKFGLSAMEEDHAFLKSASTQKSLVLLYYVPRD